MFIFHQIVGSDYGVTQNDIECIIRQLPVPFIFFGDVNVFNFIWGNSKNCNKGKLIENISDNNSSLLFTKSYMLGY